MTIAPDYAVIDMEEVLKAFDTMLRKLAVAEKLSDLQYPFKNHVAQSTSLLTIDLVKEAENYGMCKPLYDRMMAYQKQNTTRFVSMSDEGCWYFAGSSGYKRREIVIKVSQDDSPASFIPSSYFPSNLDIEAVLDTSVGSVLDTSVEVEADTFQTAKKFRGAGRAEFTSKSRQSYEKLFRDSYLPHIISSEQQLGTNQSLQIFKFNSECLDSIREDLCDENIMKKCYKFIT
jgi:hypothetical protein